MSFLRPAKLQPTRLEVAASQCWTQFMLRVLGQHRHSFADHICLRTIRARLGEYLEGKVPPSVEEELFQHGLVMLRNEVWGGDNMFTPDMFVLYMIVFYKPEMKHLEVPSLSQHADKVTVLDLLYNLGAQQGHLLQSAKIKMFENSKISIEENYLTKRVLRGFMNLTNLVLWKAADDAMLQIIGITCKNLESIDLWKSIKVTDLGLRMLLGLDAQNKTRLCKSLVQVMIKDTAVTNIGAYDLLLHCPAMETLEFSHGSFIKEFLDTIEQSYVRTHKTFSLKSLFFPVLSPDSMYNIIKSFPRLVDLSLWTSLSSLAVIKATDLPKLKTLKVGGLNYSSILSDLSSVLGKQLTTLKIETVHFDINIDDIGRDCPNLEELNIINARLSVTPPTEKQPFSPAPMFSKLRKVYFFLVQYLPSALPQRNQPPHSVTNPTGVEHPATGYTALHTILHHGLHLETVQVTGNTALTDSCLEQILAKNPLSELRRLVISSPSSQEEMVVVPLTTRSVLALTKSCPLLQCLGDLRHWAVAPAQRGIHQNMWTRVRIAATGQEAKTSSVLRQAIGT